MDNVLVKLIASVKLLLLMLTHLYGMIKNLSVLSVIILVKMQIVVKMIVQIVVINVTQLNIENQKMLMEMLKNVYVRTVIMMMVNKMKNAKNVQ